MRALALATLLLSTSALAAPFFILPGSGHPLPQNETDTPPHTNSSHRHNGTHPHPPFNFTTNFPHSRNGTDKPPGAGSEGFNHLHARADPIAQLLAIMPDSNSCDGAPFPAECTTASAAVGPLMTAFHDYQITNAAEQSALLSWVGFETGDLKFNQNHFPAPGTPGQGTRAMLMPNFVAQYAASIPQIASQTAGKDPAGILTLVQPDEFSFGSAAFFYSTQCSQSIKQGVQSGSKAGWEAFITGCVHTTIDESGGDKSRTAYWERAMQALGATAT